MIVRVEAVLVIFVLFLAAKAALMYDAVVKRTQCSELVENYLNYSCTVNLKNRTTTFIQTKVIFQYDVVNPMVRITLFYRFTVYRPFLIDVTEDFCGLAKEGKSAPVINLIWNTLKEATNLHDEGCPMRKGHTYYVKDYNIDSTNFPPELPKGDYRVDIKFKNSADQKWFFKIQDYISLSRKLMADIKWN